VDGVRSVAHDEKHRSVQELLEQSKGAPPLCRGTRGNWELGALGGSVLSWLRISAYRNLRCR
jgi:hypothetical protein